ncbi:sensor histidine kinase [Microbacterium gorillae]|uniref:sensor histidine kinase n=1 Tax=Microbacterium gorillae TaxID=1231063 RepID=UPI003D96F7C4
MSAARVAAPRPRRLTFRMRLALTYAGLLTASGAVLLTLTAVIIIWFPSYSFIPAATVSALPADAASTPMPLETGLASELAVPALQVTSREDLMQLFLAVGAVLLLAVAVLGGYIGWRIAGRMLAPLHEVSVAAKQAATGRLDHRIGLGAPRDEITELAATFDDMLGSLETAFHSHQRFAANASHELRTPLATTRAMLDVVLASGSLPKREVLVGLREMNERSVETVDALLELADIESAPGVTDARCDLAALVRASADDVGDRARERGIALSVHLTPTTISGDPRLLRLLADNLLGNAVRHNVDGGFVEVRLFGVDDRIVWEVENSGMTITPEQTGQLTEPFVRLRGRTGADRSHGLGLAIVAAIARRHHADLELKPRPSGGLRVWVSFPAS